ncbi:hypothetical protein BDZ97DRAFT_1911666 [Flammula alnicola]|nr:hypothetical protein BDZ97DRAFT_1911666 [Flammula alnicola]
MNSNGDDDDVRLPLPKFLQLFTSNGVPAPKAMAIAGKVYKEYNTRAMLAQLSDLKLNAMGIDNKEDRKLVMTALRKAGYTYKGKPLKKVKASPSSTEASGSQSPGGMPSSSLVGPTAVELLTTPTKRKRGRPDDTNEFLPTGPADEDKKLYDLNFHEILDEEILRTKSTVINRAPIMMAWAMLVAERMHFSREEALSIASVYTEMNAITKGVSLGIYNKDKERGSDAEKGGSQPYVELMGRRPLYRSQAGQWRALANGNPVAPINAFSYISRSFRQTTSHIIGALKLLADSYSAQELNDKAWSLYAEFRPEVNEWGKRSEVRCKTILELRKRVPESSRQQTQPEEKQRPAINNEASERDTDTRNPDDEPVHKKARALTIEEYEAALDEDIIIRI